MGEPAGSPPEESLRRRQQRLLALLERRYLQALVVTHPPNLFYLTGFRGSAGAAVIAADAAVLWVDPRYTLQAHTQARGVEVLEARHGLLRAVRQWLDRRSSGSVAYEESHLTCAEFEALRRRSRRNHRWHPAGPLVERLRAIKDEAEIDLIRRAGRLTAQVLEEVRTQIHPGLRESDLAAEIEYRMRRKGADGPAFETIVASGARAALPHARASSKPLESGELVILDLGAILVGYAADMTRTFFLGQASRRATRLYRAVREAQEAALGCIRDGIAAKEVDATARRALERHGLDEYFTHSTGHGVGLEIHEGPRVGRGVKTRLKSGSVITAEPGIYLEGFGGVRIEDTVAVGPQGAEVLTPASKDDWIV